MFSLPGEAVTVPTSDAGTAPPRQDGIFGAVAVEQHLGIIAGWRREPFLPLALVPGDEVGLVHWGSWGRKVLLIAVCPRRMLPSPSYSRHLHTSSPAYPRTSRQNRQNRGICRPDDLGASEAIRGPICPAWGRHVDSEQLSAPRTSTGGASLPPVTPPPGSGPSVCGNVPLSRSGSPPGPARPRARRGRWRILPVCC